MAAATAASRRARWSAERGGIAAVEVADPKTAWKNFECERATRLGESHMKGLMIWSSAKTFFFFFLRREEGLFRWCEGGERTRKTALAPPSFSLRFLQRTQGSEAEVRSLQYQVQKPIKGVEERDFEERVHRQDVERVGRSSTTVSVRSSSLFSPSFLFFFLRSNALRLSISSIDEEPDSSREQPTQLQRK